MIQAGREGTDVALARRLEATYYALTRQTARHYGHQGEGWFLTGVAGLDAPTMSRAVVEDAPVEDLPRIVGAAGDFFAERDGVWNLVLCTFRDLSRWHPELVSRGLYPSTTLDVLVRPPAPLEGPVPDVPIRLARPAETPRFTDMLMDVFRMPRRFYPALLEMTEAWRRHGARLYFGMDDDGEPVSTALLATVDGVAGVYNVGTLRNARRRGHARALMARLLEDARGADVVTLQVAPEGFVEPFYVGLGFEPLYSWRFYAPRLPRGGLFSKA